MRQNDRIEWSWATDPAVNVNISSVDAMDSVDPNGIFHIPPLNAQVGVLFRVMKESPGEYFISSGYLDDLFSQVMVSV